MAEYVMQQSYRIEIDPDAIDRRITKSWSYDNESMREPHKQCLHHILQKIQGDPQLFDKVMEFLVLNYEDVHSEGRGYIVERYGDEEYNFADLLQANVALLSLSPEQQSLWLDIDRLDP